MFFICDVRALLGGVRTIVAWCCCWSVRVRGGTCCVFCWCGAVVGAFLRVLSAGSGSCLVVGPRSGAVCARGFLFRRP